MGILGNRPTELPVPGPSWLPALRTYLLVSAAGHLVWEVVQLPLYTIWSTADARGLAIAILHCTGGDILIALATLAGVLIVIGNGAWPSLGYRRVYVLTLLAGLGYTVFSEWLNTDVRGSWTYSALMPRLPVLGTGLSPLIQWVLIPTLAMFAANPRAFRK